MRTLSDKLVKGREFLTQMFRRYYESRFDETFSLNDIEYREFGFLFWENSRFVRHFGFLDFSSLKNHIQSEVPQHIYNSAARYERDPQVYLGRIQRRSIETA